MTGSAKTGLYQFVAQVMHVDEVDWGRSSPFPVNPAVTHSSVRPQPEHQEPSMARCRCHCAIMSARLGAVQGHIGP